MDTMEAMRAWRSVSKFKPTPIPEQKLQTILNAARLAPSAENIQPWKFVIVNDEDVKREIARACQDAKFLVDAPIVTVACADSDDAVAMAGGYMNSFPVDMGIALSYLMLATMSEGTGSAWIHTFNEDMIRSILGTPIEASVVGVVLLAYPDESASPSGREQQSEVVCYNGYR